MDVVIGSGIGGLLAAAKLASLGRRVAVFERKTVAGGRFTNISYRGFTLSTGAFHMLPHGSGGPTAGMLRELGLQVKIIDSVPPATVMIGRKQYTESQFQRLLTTGQRLRVLLKSLRVKYGGIPGVSYAEFIEDVGSELLSAYADAYCRFVFSASAGDIMLRDALMAHAYTRYYGGPGIVRGGCWSIIDALCRYIRLHGGVIHLGSAVEGICVNEEGWVRGVYVGDEFVRAERVVSDIGPRETGALLRCESSDVLDAYRQSVQHVLPALGVKISFSSGDSMIGHSGVLFTPECHRIGGVVEVSAADTSLAPPGRHLFMSHQHVEPGREVSPVFLRQEVEAGIEELEELFPGFNQEDILMVQSYTGEPVNRALQGRDAEVATPIQGLYLVGDGVKDGIEVEGITRSVDSLVQLFSDFSVDHAV